MDNGASSNEDRATQASPQAPTGLGHSVSIPSAVPFAPNSDEDRQLEQRAFVAAHSLDVPEWARETIKALWFQFVMREKWFAPVRQDAPVEQQPCTPTSPEDDR